MQPARGVHLADIDGDGDLDIVSASANDNTIAWYENNGAADPSFTAADIVTNASNAQDVKVADMDGDGDLDIVSASPTDDTVAWYENNGAADPSFTKAVIATSADEVRNIDLADMDGDGDLDIVSASGVDDTIAWYENNGAADPTWTAADIATSADGAHDVYIADMDNDGDLDIVSASIHDDTIAWYENDGAVNPSWTASDIATNADYALGVHVAYMDNDGDMDIVSVSQLDDTIAWYENNGAANPTWTAADIATSADHATSIDIADIDGDGDLDIISSSEGDDTIAWYESDVASNNDTAVMAQVDDDYTATSGTLTFNAGETSKTFTVSVKEDLIPENNETVQLTLSNPSNTTVRDSPPLTIDSFTGLSGEVLLILEMLIMR